MNKSSSNTNNNNNNNNNKENFKIKKMDIFVILDMVIRYIDKLAILDRLLFVPHINC